VSARTSTRKSVQRSLFTTLTARRHVLSVGYWNRVFCLVQNSRTRKLFSLRLLGFRNPTSPRAISSTCFMRWPCAQGGDDGEARGEGREAQLGRQHNTTQKRERPAAGARHGAAHVVRLDHGRRPGLASHRLRDVVGPLPAVASLAACGAAATARGGGRRDGDIAFACVLLGEVRVVGIRHPSTRWSGAQRRKGGDGGGGRGSGAGSFRGRRPRQSTLWPRRHVATREEGDSFSSAVQNPESRRGSSACWRKRT
jgi:hypothetical protein